MANKSASPGGIAGTVAELASPIVEEYGLLLWDVRFLKEGASWILRIYIDHEDRPVSINDCVDVSRKLSALLDEKDPIEQSYCLEVSSPGADRELTREEHFAYYEGWPVALKLYRPMADGAKEIAGLLEGWENDTFTLRTEEDEVLSFGKKEVAAIHAIDQWDEDETDEDA